ncbi:hypothetical protein BRC75_01100 [Halobacteriales archaeon QH_7_69_31]|nr:MAG: hypothetical protein BRC75_01100 [Halobacteriales archaeon QH_7_69_31]
MSDLRPVTIAVAVLGLFAGGLAALGRFLPFVLDWPQGQFAVAVAVVDGLAFLLSPVAVAVVGYGAGSRVDVGEAYGRIIAVFAGVGGAAALVGGAALTLGLADTIARASILDLGLTFVFAPISIGVSFALAGLAAAAVAQFRRD